LSLGTWVIESWDPSLSLSLPLFLFLGRECPEAVLPDRALYSPTFSYVLIVNKLLWRLASLDSE
jgi:hypothetical protein